MEPERSKEDGDGWRDSDGSTGYNSSPGAATQASTGEAFSGFMPGRSPAKDSATQVIMNLCAMVDRNGGEFGLPPQVASELSGDLSLDPQIQEDSQGRLEAQEEVSRRLREELARTRRELKQLKSLNQESLQEKLVELEAREVDLQRRTEELEEQAKRQEETATLQKHILEVEIRRCAEELQKSHSKVEALEKELKAAQAQKASTKRRSNEGRSTASQEAVHRHEIAVRASFQDSRETSSPTRRPPSKEEKAQGWFSCCSVQKSPQKSQ